VQSRACWRRETRRATRRFWPRHRSNTGTATLGVACFATSLPVVRQLIAAGAASASALPPGTAQSQTVAYAALMDALSAERGCGQCAFRCRGGAGGSCADGLDILRAVLAAGVRERVDPEGNSLALRVVLRMTARDAADRVSAEQHALTILQALHAAGVDVLSRGSVDEQPVLHAAAAANAPAVVRWLVSEAGAPLEERHSDRDYTPLVMACCFEAWDAALALLAAGARVDIACDIDGTLLTIAAWARRSSTCKHRGVKLAIAARAREHAAQAAAAAKGLPSGGSGSGAGAAGAAAFPAAQLPIQVTAQRHPQQRLQPGLGPERGNSRSDRTAQSAA